MSGSIKAVLFDLDGTLVDSAPDLCIAVNRVVQELGHPPVSLSRLREVVSKGGRAMIQAALPQLSDAEREPLLAPFLAHYAQALDVESRAFDGVPELLGAIEARGLRWGIVTNKPEGLAQRVVAGMGWSQRCAVLVGGDTLATRKPDPGQLFLACDRMDIAPAHAIYVGDDLRDIQAARSAGMPSVAALWGYREPGDDPSTWGADHAFADPRQLLSPGLLPP